METNLPSPGERLGRLIVVASCPVSTLHSDGREVTDDRAIILSIDPQEAPHYFVETVWLTTGLPTDGPRRSHYNINDAVTDFADNGGGN